MINLTHYYDVTKCLNELLKFQNSLNLKYVPKVISNTSIYLMCYNISRIERLKLLEQLGNKLQHNGLLIDSSRLKNLSKGSNYWYLIVNNIKVYCKNHSRTQYTASFVLKNAPIETLNVNNTQVRCYKFNSLSELTKQIESNINDNKKLTFEEKEEVKKLLADPLGKQYTIPDMLFYPLSEIYVPLIIMSNNLSDPILPFEKMNESDKTLYFPIQANYPIVDGFIVCKHNDETFRIALSAKVDKGAKGSLFSLLTGYTIPSSNSILSRLLNNTGTDLEKIWKYFFPNGNILLRSLQKKQLTDDEKTTIYNKLTTLKESLPNMRVTPNINDLSNASYIMCCFLASTINNSKEDIAFIKSAIENYDYYQYNLSNDNGFIEVKFVDKKEFGVKVYGNKSNSHDIKLSKGRLNFELI